MRRCTVRFTPSTRTAWRNFKFARFSTHIKTHFPAEYLNETHVLTCIQKHLNGKKVLGAKIVIQNVLKRQILTCRFHLNTRTNLKHFSMVIVSSA